MEYIETMNFEVIGFFEPNVSFRLGIGGDREVSLDHRIVMPYVIPMYSPVGEAAKWQHGFFTGELLSGYINIETPTKEINDKTYENYQDELSKIAQKHDLTDMYKIAKWPDGFIW